MNWIDSHSRVDEGVTVGSCKMNRLLRRFGTASISTVFSMHSIGFLLRDTEPEWKLAQISWLFKKNSTQKTTRVFLKKRLKKNKTHQKPALLFLWKIYQEVTNKISRTLVQLSVIFFKSNKTSSNEI